MSIKPLKINGNTNDFWNTIYLKQAPQTRQYPTEREMPLTQAAQWQEVWRIIKNVGNLMKQLKTNDFIN
jgi:hypothetical protein